MDYKIILTLGILTSLLVLADSDNIQDNEIKQHISNIRREEIITVVKGKNNTDEKEGSASHFVPSFGPIQPPQHYIDPHYFHTFGPSPIQAYRYLYNNGYPYACTFSYSKYLAPFVPSPTDYYLDSSRHTAAYNPYVQPSFPYAEEYPHYLSHASGHGYPYPAPHFRPHFHPGGFYPTHYHEPVHDHNAYHGVPLPPIRPHGIPHNNPHAFHSVVNYGHINLHHGDHFEPHDNGRAVPYLPYPKDGFLQTPQLPGYFLHPDTKVLEGKKISDSAEDAENRKEQSPSND